jgi:hypothetical protein
VRAFSFFIEDDRYNVPTLQIMLLRDIERAKELAADRLKASPHHLSIEVSEGSHPLFRVSRQKRADRALGEKTTDLSATTH